MQQKRRKYDSRDRLIQYAIEIFDLVDLDADTDTGKPIRRRFLGTNTSHAKPYAGTKQSVSYMAGSP